MATTTGSIMTALYGITYATGSYTKEERFQLHEEDFEEFNKFPLIVIVDGDEENEPQANLKTESAYHPQVHFFTEGETIANMKTWRDDIRNAIYEDSTLRGLAILVEVDSIIPSEPENRKLQHLAFGLTITFDINHA